MRLSWWFQSACEAPAPKETVATDSAEFAPAAAAKKMCLIADFSGKAGGSTPSTVGLSVSLTAAGQAIVKESDEYPVCPAARHSSRPDARIFNLCQRAIFSLISGGRVSSKAWTQWVALNANNLAWIALIVAGVLVTGLLV